MWPVARAHTDRHTEWLLWAHFQGFRIFSFNLLSRISPKSVLGSQHADRQTDTHMKVNTWIIEATFSGFQEFSINLSSRIGLITNNSVFKMNKKADILAKNRYHMQQENIQITKQANARQNTQEVSTTSTTPSCSGAIPAQKPRGNSVLGVVFSHTMPKMDFPYSHCFSWEKTH